jgi:hypothetical protein
LADGWWSVAREVLTQQGRLDIVLRNRGPSGPATVVIENKWNHGLGDRQLERYGQYLMDIRRSGQHHRRCLVYLTRRGEDPLPPLSVDFVPVSYCTDISRLIRDTLKSLGEIAPSALREPLWQYCAILEDRAE